LPVTVTRTGLGLLERQSALRQVLVGAWLGRPNAVNNFQVLAERNLDLNDGPLDTDRRHNLTLSGRMEVSRTKGLTVSGLGRFMSGRPFTILDTNVDVDRNGILFDPLPAGTDSGVGNNAITVKNKGGRNGAYMGPTTFSWMSGSATGCEWEEPGRSICSSSSSTSRTGPTSRTRPATRESRRRSSCRRP